MMKGKIVKNKIILVEGIDEVNFFEALFKHLELEDIQVIESKGKEQFPSELSLTINDPGFENVVTLAIVRDADKSHAAAIQSIKHYLKNNGLPSPSEHASFIEKDNLKVGVFIAPGFVECGMLETLVLESLAEHPVNLLSSKYVNELRENLLPVKETATLKFPRNEAKAQMHSFLAGMEKFVPSLGIAAKKGYFDLSSEVFKDIRDFLIKM